MVKKGGGGGGVYYVLSPSCASVDFKPYSCVTAGL